MKILVTGKNGQLGRSIKNLVQDQIDKNCCLNDYKFIDSKDLDFEDTKNINSFFVNKNFDLLINCAAYTNVDKAELNEEKSYLINFKAISEIAKAAKKNKFSLIHISTDYVFDGDKIDPYTENDSTSPLNVYGKTKLAGEKAILSNLELNSIIIRTSWLYSNFGSNFVDTILKLSKKNSALKIVSDQIGSPTYAKDLAKTILKIIDSGKFVGCDKPSQIYHYSNEGHCSWYDFAKEIVKISQIKCSVYPISSKEYIRPAKRPRNSSLSSIKISREFDLNINYWKESLINYLKNL